MNIINTFSTSEKPIFNIGAVTRTTGIPVVTLHAWERRYGFPTSTRTAGGHRLFSAREIQRLQFVKNKIDHGMQTRQAIKLVLGEQTSSLLTNSLFMRSTQGNKSSIGNSIIEVPPTKLLDALLQQDIQRADQILGELLAFYSPEELTLQLVGPTLHEIGERWVNNTISIADEHFISNFLRQKLLIWMNTGPRPRSNDSIVLACAPGELHEGSLLMLGVLLGRQAWQIIYLGQNVPLLDLASHINKYPPQAVVLVAMCKESVEALSAWPDMVHQISGRPMITFGGKAFNDDPALQKKVPGIFLGDNIQAGVDRLNYLLQG